MIFSKCLLFFSFQYKLRELISKSGQTTAYTFSHTIPVWCQNQNFSQKCTSKHMNFWPDCKTRVSVSISSFGSKAKMSPFAPNIFSTFYQISGSLPYTVQYMKNLEGRFSVSARYGPFWLLTWSKMKNFDFFHKKDVYLLKTNDYCLMKKVKILHFWPCQ